MSIKILNWPIVNILIIQSFFLIFTVLIVRKVVSIGALSIAKIFWLIYLIKQSVDFELQKPNH
jgi:hypothetical protein